MSLKSVVENRQIKNCTKPEGKSMIPDSFLTPDSAGDRSFSLSKNTVAQLESSAFLTPSCSQERYSGGNLHCYDLSDPPILDLDLQKCEKTGCSKKNQRLSLLPEDRVIGSFKSVRGSRVDFVARLLDLGCELITKNIYCRLDPRELCRAATVSRTWRRCIQQDRDLHERWRSNLQKYREHYNFEKENLGTSKWSSELERDPLIEISNQNINRTLRTRQQLKREKDVVHPLQNPTLPRTCELLKRCPNCTSPSRNENEKNQYLCEVCGLKFCSMCLKDSKLHNATECPGVDISQGKKKITSKRTKKDTVGSKTSRARVRRL